MREPVEADREKRFEAAWRVWAGRPARRSPRQAADDVADAIRVRRARLHVWLPAAVAASLLVAVTLSTRWISSPVRQVPVSPAEPFQTAPLSPGQVIFWLDEETPLYMNFQPPGDDGTGGGIR